MKSINQLTTLCGLDCINCDFYENNVTDEKNLINQIKYGISKEEIICKGCDILRNQCEFHIESFECCNTIDSQKYCNAFINYNNNQKEAVL